MIWKSFCLHTSAEAEDTVAALLMELGVEGVEIEDNIPPAREELEQMLFTEAGEELLPEAQAPDGTACIRFYLHQAGRDDEVLPQSGCSAVDDSYTIHDRIWTEAETETLLSALQDGLSELSAFMDLGELLLEESTTEDSDWRNSWKQYYKPLEAGPWLILPSWEQPDEVQQGRLAEGTLRPVWIDPGTAFGTGTHETTRLCLEGLERFPGVPQRVLDLGTGSGIVGLCALVSHPDCRVVGTELDPACEAVLRENLRLNGLKEEQFRLYMGNLLSDAWLREVLAGETFDLVFSNILAPVVAALAAPGALDPFVRPGGLWVSSGIIESRAAEVETAIRANPAWRLTGRTTRGEWVSFTAEKQ